MEENKVLPEVDEAVAEVDETVPMSNDELKEAIDGTVQRIRTQAMILGYRTACMTIMQMISGWHKPNCSHREYERIFKKLEEFCGKALKQEEKTTETNEETVQN
jgi:hypothetical protein